MRSKFCSHVVQVSAVRFRFWRCNVSVACKDRSCSTSKTILISFDESKGELVPHVFDNVTESSVTVDAVACDPKRDCTFALCWGGPCDVPHPIRFCCRCRCVGEGFNVPFPVIDAGSAEFTARDSHGKPGRILSSGGRSADDVELEVVCLAWCPSVRNAVENYLNIVRWCSVVAEATFFSNIIDVVLLTTDS